MTKNKWLFTIDKIIYEIDKNYEVLSKLNMEDSGKSKMFADKENDRCKQILNFQRQNIIDFFNLKEKRFLPLGSVLILTPFSSAYTSILHKLIPSLVVGNKCIIKSSDFTIQCSKFFIDLIKKCLPKNIANKIVFVSELNIVKQILHKKQFDAILFTGKSETAKEIKRNIGRKRGIFETGSLALAYIHNDVDLNIVANQICENSFAQNGMRCIGLKNVFIQNEIYETLKAKILDLYLLYKNNENYIREFRNLDTKREILNNINFFINNGYQNLNNDLSFPIIIEETQVNKVKFLREMYGPVLCLHKVDNFNQINLDYLKRSSLATSIYANEPKVIENFIKRDCYTGSILVNKGPAIRDDNKPFGGLYDENENKESFWDVINVVSNLQIIKK